MIKIQQKTILTLTALSILAFFGCSFMEEVVIPNPVEGECIISGVNAPSWACGSYEEETRFVAVGSAPISKLGHNFSRTEAVANGRSSLVQQIQLEVKNKVESYMRSSGVKDEELVEKVISQVSRQVSKVTLEGSKQISYWENDGDNSIYVLVAVNKNTVIKYMNEAISSDFGDADVSAQQQNALNALKEL